MSLSNYLSTIMNHSDDEEGSDNSEDVPVLQRILTIRQSIFGQIRTCGNVSTLEWCFVLSSAVSIIFGLAFNIYRMATLSTNSDEYVFALVVLINLIFCVWYLLHGIFQEQPFEILMFVITSLLISLLITLNYAAAGDDSSNVAVTSGHLKLIRFIVTTILTLPNALLGIRVGWQYWSSGNLIFKTVGGDMTLQRMCRTLFFGMSLLVFDAQAFVTCLVLIIQRGISNLTDEDIVIITTGLAFTILWIAIGYTAIRKEKMHLVWLFFATSLIQPLYSIYLLVDGFHEMTERYSTIRTDSIFAAVTALILGHFSLLATLTVIASNFGKGLQAAVYGYDELVQETSPPVVQAHTPGASTSTTATGDILAGKGRSASLLTSEQRNYGTSGDSSVI